MDIAAELFSIAEANTPLPFAWGDVLGVSPTLVRFAGDTGDTLVPRKLANYTPTTNDRVILARVGGTWVILGRVT